MRDNAANLGLMLDSLEKLHVLIAGMNFTQFRRDIKAQRAVIMQLRIIGELAGRFSSEVSGAIDTPWREMADLHDLVSHNNLSPDIETCGWLRESG